MQDITQKKTIKYKNFTFVQKLDLKKDPAKKVVEIEEKEKEENLEMKNENKKERNMIEKIKIAGDLKIEEEEAKMEGEKITTETSITKDLKKNKKKFFVPEKKVTP